MRSIIKLIRLKHWIKNFFIFAPLFFSLNLFNFQMLLKTVIAFFSFSFAASFVYIINDIRDRESDANHPVKKSRPIASGKINPVIAFIIGLIMFIIGITGSFFIGYIAALIILVYFVMNLLYSFFLKNMIILDVFIIAIGFCLRILLGAKTINVELSKWMLATTFCFSLIIGFGKRRHELTSLGDEAENHRNILGLYNKKFLDTMIIISTAVTIISYALYTMDHHQLLIFTVPFVLYGLFRYLHIIYYQGKGGSPEDIVVSDPGIIISVILWIIFFFIIFYFKDKINFEFDFLKKIKFISILDNVSL